MMPGARPTQDDIDAGGIAFANLGKLEGAPRSGFALSCGAGLK
jgi:hypothetical protein